MGFKKLADVKKELDKIEEVEKELEKTEIANFSNSLDNLNLGIKIKKIRQLTQSFFIPEVGVTYVLKFLDAPIRHMTTPKYPENPMPVVTVVNIHTGEEVLLVLKKVMINTFQQLGFLKADEDGTFVSSFNGEIFAIKVSEKGFKKYQPVQIALIEAE